MADEKFDLDKIEIATPCPADWDKMKGDDQKRFCGLCKLNVYNLSGLSRQDATELVKQSEGQICVRMFRRPDGTILTQDCPVGLKALWKTQVRRWGVGIALVTFFFVAAAYAWRSNTLTGKIMGGISNERIEQLMKKNTGNGRVDSLKAQPIRGEHPHSTMGDLVYPHVKGKVKIR